MSNNATVPPLVSAPEITAQLTVSVVLDLKPGKNQTEALARAEFLRLFGEYLAAEDGSFQTDYGPSPWGGYEGPTVTSVTVLDPEESR